MNSNQQEPADESKAPEPSSSSPAKPQRVSINELIDPALLDQDLSMRAKRAALPRGWVLEDDGLHARKDLRLWFREGWILLVGLVSFGAAGIGIFVMSFPRGARAWTHALLLIGSLLLIGGVIAPMVTRALMGKPEPKPKPRRPQP